MKPKIIQKIEKEQFDLEQVAMAAGLSALRLPKENRIEILRYFGWLCFDRILLEETRSENLPKQNKRHQELYEKALQDGLKMVKPDRKTWDKAGRAMLEIYRKAIQRSI